MDRPRIAGLKGERLETSRAACAQLWNRRNDGGLQWVWLIGGACQESGTGTALLL